MMHMTFYWGIKVTLLFDFWKTDSYLSYILTLLACFFVSIFYQYLENRRLRFRSIAASKPSSSGLTDPLVARFPGDRYRPSAAKSATAILFGVNSAIGYMLMLAVMSFNGGVFVAVILGLTAGYLAFRSEDGEGVISSENPCACA